MPIFNYTATSRDGKQIKANHEANTRDDVAQFLHDQGYVIISIDEDVKVDLLKLLNVQIGGVPLAEKVIFAKQLSTMLNAGLPLIQSLSIMVQQTENKNLKERLYKVYKDIESGMKLSESFRKEGVMFNELQLSLLVAGETSGNLSEIVAKIAIDLEKSKNLRSKVVGALIYPIIIFVVMIVVFISMMVFMIPAVKDLYADFGVNELPFITQLLVNLSELITSPVGVVSMVTISLFTVLGGRYYYTTESGRRQIDKLLLKVPVWGGLSTKVQLAEFNRLLSMLITSGVPIVEALRVVAEALGNVMFKEAVNNAAKEVIKGNSLTVPLSNSEVFPLVMLKMLATGEQTGKLDQITADMGEYYEKEVEDITNNLTKLMEPIILLSVGLLVAFMAIAIYLPLYSIGQFI